MNNFIEKVKEIYTKVKEACSKFLNETKAGQVIKKMMQVLFILLILGGIICTITGAAILRFGLVPWLAIIIVDLCAIDELVKNIKEIIN